MWAPSPRQGSVNIPRALGSSNDLSVPFFGCCSFDPLIPAAAFSPAPVALQLFVAFLSVMWKYFCSPFSVCPVGGVGFCCCLSLGTQSHLFSPWFGVFQTCFVDCLIEQTHPEIRKRYDQDVSELWVSSCLGTCGESVVLWLE